MSVTLGAPETAAFAVFGAGSFSPEEVCVVVLKQAFIFVLVAGLMTWCGPKRYTASARVQLLPAGELIVDKSRLSKQAFEEELLLQNSIFTSESLTDAALEALEVSVGYEDFLSAYGESASADTARVLC